MPLPRNAINSIKGDLHSALSAKDPHGLARAVDLPPLPKVAAPPTGGSQQNHVEVLKVDGADYSNVLNPLLDAHLAIKMVSESCSKSVALRDLPRGGCSKPVNVGDIGHENIIRVLERFNQKDWSN